MNVDPEEAARLYRERVVGPYRELLPKSAVDNIEEQLSGACTVEIAAFDEFAKLLGRSSRHEQSTITSSLIPLQPAIRFGFCNYLQHGLISSRPT